MLANKIAIRNLLSALGFFASTNTLSKINQRDKTVKVRVYTKYIIKHCLTNSASSLMKDTTGI